MLLVISSYIFCVPEAFKWLAGNNNLIFGPRPHVTTLHHHQHHDYTSVRLSDQQQQQQPKRRIAVSKLLHCKCVDRAFCFDTKAHHIHLYTGYSSRNKTSSTLQVMIKSHQLANVVVVLRVSQSKQNPLIKEQNCGMHALSGFTTTC